MVWYSILQNIKLQWKISSVRETSIGSRKKRILLAASSSLTQMGPKGSVNRRIQRFMVGCSEIVLPAGTRHLWIQARNLKAHTITWLLLENYIIQCLDQAKFKAAWIARVLPIKVLFMCPPLKGELKVLVHNYQYMCKVTLLHKTKHIFSNIMSQEP